MERLVLAILFQDSVPVSPMSMVYHVTDAKMVIGVLVSNWGVRHAGAARSDLHLLSAIRSQENVIACLVILDYGANYAQQTITEIKTQDAEVANAIRLELTQRAATVTYVTATLSPDSARAYPTL